MMVTLTSIALVLAAALQAQPTVVPPTVRTVPVPSPIITRSLTPEQKARAEKFNACRAAAYGQDYLPQPAIWRIKDEDTNVYIFGSFHLLPMGFDWRSPQFNEIVAKSDKLILESISSSVVTPAGTASSVAPLRDRLSGERRAKWLGMSYVLPKPMTDRIDGLQDAQAAFRIASLPAQSNPLFLLFSPGVETQLQADFRRTSKPTGGLEQSGSAMALLDTLSPATQRAFLEQVLDRVGETKPSAEPFRMFNNWARGEAADDPSDTPQNPEITRILLDVRNAAWVPNVLKELGPPGTRLIVVGAAHLRGTNNLLDLLAAKGIKAERVSPSGPAKPRAPYLPKPKNLSDCGGMGPLPMPPAPPPPPPPPPPVVTAPAVPSSTQ